MEKFQKIDKEYEYTDDSVNVYGFRLLTSGYQLAEFQRNPIGYYMHQRLDDKDGGVLVRWTDFRHEGDKVFAKPIINLSHPRGQRTVDEILNGFLNAASVGHIIALEISDDPDDKLPGQSGPTVTKWYNRELSLVDIPGNNNALAELFDKDDNPINLADFSNKPPKSMKVALLFTATMLAAMKLNDAADQNAVEKGFADLMEKAGKYEAAQLELDDLKASTNKKDVDALLAAALAAGKVTQKASEQLAARYKDAPADLKDLLDAMPAYKSVVEQIDEKKSKMVDLADKSWDELSESGQLENLKATDPELFKAKYKETFGVHPKM